MNYPKYFLCFCLLIISFVANAQTIQKAIYLKNGEILKGQIIEENEKTLKVAILGGSVFVISKDNITKIIEEDIPIALRKNKRKDKIKRASYHILNVGFQSGINRSNGILHGSSFQYIFGRQLNQNFGLGLGFGLDLQDRGNDYENFIPLFIEGKGSLEKYFPSYFYSLQLGYSLNNSLYFHPKIGYKFSNYKKIDFNVELGYVLQQVGYIGLKNWSNADPNIHRMYSYNRFVVRLSIQLKKTPKRSK